MDVSGTHSRKERPPFNWGAFLLWWCWAFVNGNTPQKWIAAVLIAAYPLAVSDLALVAYVSHLNDLMTGLVCVAGMLAVSIFAFAFALYLGINGNRILERQRELAPGDFAFYVRSWNQAGFAFLIFGVPAIAYATVRWLSTKSTP
jgi:hypothetical protein